MTEEKRFSVGTLLRVNVDVDTRDVTGIWTETDEIVVRGANVDALVQADELFITGESGRRHGTGPIEIELPSQPIRCEFKVERGDIRLTNALGKIEIQADSGDVSLTKGTGELTISSGKGDLDIQEYDGEVTLNSGSGDKSLSDITGEVTVRSGKGDVRLTGGEGRTVIAVGSGDVNVRDRSCEEFTLAGASGDVSIQGGRIGRGTVSTASGDIRCHSALSIASYDFTASSGDISFSIPRELAVRVDAATTRGSVNTDLPLVAIAQRGPRNPHGKRLVGSTGDSSDRADITLRTSSGDIDVRWASNANPVAARPVETPGAGSSQYQTSHVGSTGTSSSEDDRKRAILSALADGAVSVEEAGRLLDAIDRSDQRISGAK